MLMVLGIKLYLLVCQKSKFEECLLSTAIPKGVFFYWKLLFFSKIRFHVENHHNPKMYISNPPTNRVNLFHLKVERSSDLSLETLNTFLCQCPNIKSVGALANWGKVIIVNYIRVNLKDLALTDRRP